eukprot:s2960_g7.t1
MLQQELTAKVQVTEELTQRAAARRAEAQQLAALSRVPPALHGKALSSYMRNGAAFCGAFQCDPGQAVSSWGGRPPEPAEPPRVADKRCPREPEGPPPAALAAKKAKVPPSSSEEEVVEEEEALPIPEVLVLQGPDQKFDRLATIRGKLAEAPSLIYENSMGGKVWLSGLPTRGTVVALQVACMDEAPSSPGGLVLPNALLMHLRIAHARLRTADFEEVWPVLRNTVFAGEAVLVHCLSGRHRAFVTAPS